MSEQKYATSHAEVSTGHQLAEAKYLDNHFEAFRPEYEYMLKLASLKRSWTVLDAGVGGGSFLPLIANSVGKDGVIHALDLAQEILIQ